MFIRQNFNVVTLLDSADVLVLQGNEPCSGSVYHGLQDST